MISALITTAVEVLKVRFPDVDFIILSSEMYHLEPKDSSSLGKIGVTLYVDGSKVFFAHDSVAEGICGPYGHLIADSFMYGIIMRNKGFNLDTP